MWKNSLNHSSIIVKHQIACVSIYFNKCKKQLVNGSFNILKVNGSTHLLCWQLNRCKKKPLIHYIIVCKSKLKASSISMSTSSNYFF